MIRVQGPSAPAVSWAPLPRLPLPINRTSLDLMSDEDQSCSGLFDFLVYTGITGENDVNRLAFLDCLTDDERRYFRIVVSNTLNASQRSLLEASDSGDDTSIETELRDPQSDASRAVRSIRRGHSFKCALVEWCENGQGSSGPTAYLWHLALRAHKARKTA